jgi:putative PEP-CTERM system histidine kinase
MELANAVGAITYGIAAAAFLLLFVLLVISWRGRLVGILLAMASMGTVFWAVALAYRAARPASAVLPSAVLEILRSALWFAFLLVVLGYAARSSVRLLRAAAIGIGAFCAVILAATLFLGGASGTQPGMFAVFGGVVFALIGLVLVEQLFRNGPPQGRWGIKFLCLALGGVFAYDFYLYSDALLFRRVSEDIWTARGAINALAVPLLVIASARNPNWSLDVSVSRRVVFHSTAMLGAAVYLLTMAGAGYYIRHFGGTWGVVLQVTFLFGVVLLLLLMLFSGTLRARLKIFLSKHFFSYRYDYREEWLRFTRTLSDVEPGVQLRERSIQAIAELVDSPGGALWLASDSGTFERAAHWNMPAAKGSESSESSLCQFLQARQSVIDLTQYQARPEYYDGLEIAEWIRSIPDAWLVVPLILHEQMLGFVVLARSKGRLNLNWEVSDILRTAGQQAASYLAQLEAAKALLVARQFESFNRMSAFVVHDLKNLIAQLSLLLSNAERHRCNPAFQEDMVETVANSVEKMKRLLVQLRGTYTLEPAVPVPLDPLLGLMMSARQGLKPVPRLELAGGSISVLGHPARLERVIGHLIQNAVEATPPEGGVVVQLSRQNASAVITIADTGRGMSDDFMRNRLFQPFESTKATGMGIGTYEARQYVRELGGRIDVESRELVGTVFRVTLPLYISDEPIEMSAAVERRA